MRSLGLHLVVHLYLSMPSINLVANFFMGHICLRNCKVSLCPLWIWYTCICTLKTCSNNMKVYYSNIRGFGSRQPVAQESLPICKHTLKNSQNLLSTLARQISESSVLYYPPSMIHLQNDQTPPITKWYPIEITFWFHSPTGYKTGI